jgi:transcriptional regulator with XRE-family HTH domain
MENKEEQILEDTAKRFKLFRQEENLTQAQMAAAINKNQSQVVRYESGRLAIPIDTVKALEEVFGMNVYWFFDGTGNRKGKEEKSNMVTDIKTLRDNNLMLANEIKRLKRNFSMLHNDFHAFKDSFRKN